jgi:hypothetical protein
LTTQIKKFDSREPQPKGQVQSKEIAVRTHTQKRVSSMLASTM